MVTCVERASLPTWFPESRALDVPVLAAGGIVDGRGSPPPLRWGAQGVVIGTGFLATHESFAHDYHKERSSSPNSATPFHTEPFISTGRKEPPYGSYRTA